MNKAMKVPANNRKLVEMSEQDWRKLIVVGKRLGCDDLMESLRRCIREMHDSGIRKGKHAE